MKNQNSVPLDPEEDTSVNWIVDGRTFSILVPSKFEKSYRDASALVTDSYARWKDINVGRTGYNEFDNMNLAAVEALANGLRMQDEYRKLLEIVEKGLDGVQAELPSNDET